MTEIPPEYLNQIVTGDARELAQRIPDESVDLVLTDPPFGIGFKYSNGYQDDPDKYIDLLRWTISESNRVIKPGGYIFIFQAINRLRETWQYFQNESRLFSVCKNFVQMNSGVIAYGFDPAVFWKKSGGLFVPNGRDWFLANTANTNNRGMGNVDFHDCPRPLDAITYMVDNFCPDNGIVLDWFMGSGTSALAAKITGREYIGFEIISDTAERARERVRNTQPPLFVLQPEQSVMELSE